jgi:sulfopyruvate decarboxylase subunit alpha
LKEEAIKDVIEGFKDAGIDFITSLPCTSFREVIPGIMDDPDFVHVPVNNEGDAIGICAGAYFGGRKPALLAENSGLVLAAHSLMGTAAYLGSFPMLLVLDHKGDFGEYEGYWYFGGGRTAPPVMDALQIPYTIVRESKNFKAEIIRGQKTTVAYGKPVAVLLSGEDVW